MLQYLIERKCLSCKYFRLKEIDAGFCKVEKILDGIKNYHDKKTDDVCKRWKDCGQQVHIRTGWIKAQKKKLIKE